MTYRDSMEIIELKRENERLREALQLIFAQTTLSSATSIARAVLDAATDK